MSSKDKTHCSPDKFDPSLTSTNANVFCFRTVRTHPFTRTGPSLGLVASTAFTRGRTVEGLVTSEADVVVLIRRLIECEVMADEDGTVDGDINIDDLPPVARPMDDENLTWLWLLLFDDDKIKE